MPDLFGILFILRARHNSTLFLFLEYTAANIYNTLFLFLEYTAANIYNMISFLIIQAAFTLIYNKNIGKYEYLLF